MKYAACLLVAVVCSGAFASEPGQPLDCSDWVSLVPGFSCEESPVPFDRRGSNLAIDNQGFKLYIDRNEGFRVARMNPAAGAIQFVGRIQGREAPNGSCDQIEGSRMCPSEMLSPWQCSGSLWQSNVVWFDPSTGALDIPVISKSPCGQNPNYSELLHTLRIRGFAPLMAIFDTFVPQTAALAFTVPLKPEGMAGADSFDTYWGPLAKPLDFTQAHSLACDYPATAPHVGDYLTLADTVPTPAPGQGVYYVTSATYQGKTRYGRKTTAGNLTGRDPALLPACVP